MSHGVVREKIKCNKFKNQTFRRVYGRVSLNFLLIFLQGVSHENVVGKSVKMFGN